MLRHDFHLHTRFSVDGRVGPRDLCLEALGRGYAAICFTDHCDFDPADRGCGFFDYIGYRGAVTACREEFGNSLTIGFGVEIDYHHTWEDEIRAFLRDKEFDLILGSVHYFQRRVLAGEDERFPCLTQRQVYAEYFGEVLALARSGLCQGLAHLDVIERRGAKLYGPYDPGAYLDCLDPIFAAAIERGLALEINLSGYRQGLDKPTPGLEVVDLYRQAGGRLITVGSDAHRADRCCPDRPEVWDYLERHDFTLWEPSPGFWST